MTIIPAFGSLEQKDCCELKDSQGLCGEFQISLGYRSLSQNKSNKNEKNQLDCIQKVIKIKFQDYPNPFVSLCLTFIFCSMRHVTEKFYPPIFGTY